ncbi:c-type cytochrome [Xanthomonas albilineans]|uniref:Putative cytochrome c protein n=1 Tax=Xanthomonas albilineans (strain GPE PC73 / CFBP 7063) TaxID=380358 RepID=D2UCK8_XANAP|nr:c-type cytochrome [Xanthomonas albilineans]QHQ27589.1 putative cytochrome c precursor protein [Xanthomonas albilineans]CBA15371.1 putative cytochrome c precursor protein [Xanthomonas albilineans GPE PC73]
MRHARVLAFAGLVISVAAAVAFAQIAVVPIPDNAPVRTTPLESDVGKVAWGDAKAGQAKAAACAACHGPDGNPSLTMYPRIAGQMERYSARQMALIAHGERTSGPVAAMVPFVQALGPQDMRDIGAYFATQKAGAGIADDAVIAEGPYAGMKFYEVGQQLYRGGDPVRGIPACMACHGPTGAGNPGPAYPHLAGQRADYVARRLQEYQAGTTQERDPTLFKIMAQVAKPLTDQEIKALGSYLQGLHDHADDAAATPAKPAPATPQQGTPAQQS